MIENIEVTRCPNGAVILTDSMAGVRSATLGFFFRVGSRHEPLPLNGISHFIEHCVFKGTARRTALDIAVEQDRLGGGLEAFTTHEETGFAIKVIDDDLAQAFDLIADMVLDPKFEASELENERRVIIEEMKMTEDSPEEHLGDIFNRAFFPDHPLGLNIAGTPSTVSGFDRETTQSYHSELFGASNLVIAAAGYISHTQIVGLADNYLTAAPIGRTVKDGEPPEMAAPIVVTNNPNLEQSHLIMAVPMVGAADERRYAADLLANVAGGGTSSRLWQKIREDKGLAYNVGAGTSMLRDCGFFSVFAGTSPDQAGEVVDITIDELGKIARSGITKNELALAKQQSVTAILLSLEDSAERMGSLAHFEMTFGRQISVEETIERVNAVSLDDIDELTSEFFTTEKIAFAALGALDGLTVTRERLALS